MNGHTKNKNVKYYTLALLLFLIFTGMLVSSRQTFVQVAQAEKENPLVAEIQKQVETLENEILDRLMLHESSNHKVDDGDLFYTFDPSKALYESCIEIGGVMNQECLSYGPYQMKISFVQEHYKKIYDKPISQRDALDLTQDEAVARNFAKECIVKVQGCIWRWSTAEKPENKEFFEFKIQELRRLMSLIEN